MPLSHPTAHASAAQQARLTPLVRTRLANHLLACLLGACLLSVSVGPAHAAKKKPTADRSVTVKKPKTDSGSAETRTERDRRLSRECKGRPNAGACQGYTR